jgi:hypothetical protein
MREMLRAAVLFIHLYSLSVSTFVIAIAKLILTSDLIYRYMPHAM